MKMKMLWLLYISSLVTSVFINGILVPFLLVCFALGLSVVMLAEAIKNDRELRCYNVDCPKRNNCECKKSKEAKG